MGDLPGIRARLEHLSWLGVDAIWITPFYPSPMATATAMYHSGKNPLKRVTRTSEAVLIPRGLKVRRLHKAFLRYHDPNNWPALREALRASVPERRKMALMVESMADGVLEPTPEVFASLHEEALLQQRTIDDLDKILRAVASQQHVLAAHDDLALGPRRLDHLRQRRGCAEADAGGAGEVAGGAARGIGGAVGITLGTGVGDRWSRLRPDRHRRSDHPRTGEKGAAPGEQG